MGQCTPTATPTGVKSSQLVITSYAVSVDPLQPGETFTLTMTVQNMGNAKAQQHHHDRRRRFKRNEWRRDTGARRRIGRER